jgi:mRNA interferase MazF
MIRGDVCYYTFKTPDKRRPVVILTRTEIIGYMNTITIAPITSTIRDNATSVWLDEIDGMKEPCAINLDLIQTVSKDRLGSYITHLSEDRMTEVFEAIRFAFGFDRT